MFELYDFQFDEEIIIKFEKFLQLFKEKNSVVNLSSLRDEYSIIEKHFIDSLFLTKFTKLSWKIADIWTWWGFPLLPLAIVDDKMMKWWNDEMNNEKVINPNYIETNANKNSYDSEINSEWQDLSLNSNLESLNFYWIDSIAKKLKAIEEFATDLWLENIKTIHSRFEDIWHDKQHRESFDYVLSRATAYFPTLLEYAIPLLKVWWIFIAYKLDNDIELKEWEKALKELNCRIIDTKKYSLAWTQRILIFVEKIWVTNVKYPRNAWIPLKKPII